MGVSKFHYVCYLNLHIDLQQTTSNKWNIVCIKMFVSTDKHTMQNAHKHSECFPFDVGK